MEMESVRKYCPHCAGLDLDGHNSMTYDNNNNNMGVGARCVKIFGVCFPKKFDDDDPIMKKSASMGNLTSHNVINNDNDNEIVVAGYLSDDKVQRKAVHERKKGM